MATSNLLENISVNLNTGAIGYPELPGFTLDMEKVYRVAGMFAAHCPADMAVKQAIHQQLAAHKGLAGLR